MTASSVFVANDAAYLLTDTAVLSPDGTGAIWKLASKVVQSERLRIAASLSGDANVVEYEDGRLSSPLGAVHELLEASATQQEAMKALPDALEGTDRILLEMTNGSGNFRLTIALWSEDGPQGFFVCSSGDRLPGVEPFTLVRVNEFVHPNVPLELDPDRLAADTSEAVAMLEAQRRKRWAEGNASGFFTIGGEGQLTRVDERGITTKALVRWPDSVGKRIEPDRRRLLGLFGR